MRACACACVILHTLACLQIWQKWRACSICDWVRRLHQVANTLFRLKKKHLTYQIWHLKGIWNWKMLKFQNGIWKKLALFTCWGKEKAAILKICWKGDWKNRGREPCENLVWAKREREGGGGGGERERVREREREERERERKVTVVLTLSIAHRCRRRILALRHHHPGQPCSQFFPSSHSRSRLDDGSASQGSA